MERKDGCDGGRRLIRCWRSRPRKRPRCYQRLKRWPKPVVLPDLPTTGKKAMNCGGNYTPAAGKCGTPKTDKKLAAVQAFSAEVAFAPAQFIELEHTTYAKLFENLGFIWDLL